MSQNATHPVKTLEVHVTADEAFPALERLFLSAEKEIQAGFRIFDLATELRSDEAREIGETWFDLFRHTLNRGVSISLMLSDFDPIVGTQYHRKSWASAKQLSALREASRTAKLDFRISLHPAKAGFFPRAMFWWKLRKKLQEQHKDKLTPGLPRSPDSFFDVSPVTHHQKLAVFDRSTLYIGGLDLDERRFDTYAHNQQAQETWQDVQVVVTGSVAEAACRHLETLEKVVAGETSPPAKADGFLRTVSARRRFAPFHISPRILVSEIEDAHLKAIDAAKGLIYLETQYFRHQELASALAMAAQKNTDLHLIVVIPAAPDDVAFEGNEAQDARMGEQLQADAVSTVRQAFESRALFCAPAQMWSADQTGDRSTLNGSPIVYVHSKVSIFDCSEAIVSSANLNGRSFRWDTEAGVHLTNPEHVRQLGDKMSAHWMRDRIALHGACPEAVFKEWRGEVERNTSVRPEERNTFLLPYDETDAQAFGQNIPVVPNELV